MLYKCAFLIYSNRLKNDLTNYVCQHSVSVSTVINLIYRKKEVNIFAGNKNKENKGEQCKTIKLFVTAVKKDW